MQLAPRLVRSHSSPSSMTPLPQRLQAVVSKEVQSAEQAKVPLANPWSAQAWPRRSSPSQPSSAVAIPSPQTGQNSRMAAQRGSSQSASPFFRQSWGDQQSATSHSQEEVQFAVPSTPAPISEQALVRPAIHSSP